MKLLKQVAAIAAVAGATFVATTAIIGAFETTEKMVKDGKKHKKLQPDDVEHLLTHKVYDINHVYDQVKALFKHYSPTEEESSVLKTLSPWRFESLSDEYEEITFETSYPDKGKKKAYYKVFLLPSENENVTDVILRLHIDDWDGYMDLVVCRGVAKNINSELFFEVLETCPFLMDGPVQDDFIVFERFIDKATKKIIVKNKVSGAKFLAGKFSDNW